MIKTMSNDSLLQFLRENLKSEEAERKEKGDRTMEELLFPLFRDESPKDILPRTKEWAEYDYEKFCEETCRDIEADDDIACETLWFLKTTDGNYGRFAYFEDKIGRKMLMILGGCVVSCVEDAFYFCGNGIILAYYDYDALAGLLQDNVIEFQAYINDEEETKDIPGSNYGQWIVDFSPLTEESLSESLSKTEKMFDAFLSAFEVGDRIKVRKLMGESNYHDLPFDSPIGNYDMYPDDEDFSPTDEYLQKWSRAVDLFEKPRRK